MSLNIDIRGDDNLLQLLMGADAADISVLVDHLTDSGAGRLSLSKEVRELLQDACERKKFSRDVLSLLIREIQHFGGNTLINIFRRSGVPYAEIVRDVLEHLGAAASRTETVESMELRVLGMLATQVWEEMSEEEQAEFASQFTPSGTFHKFSFEYIQAAFKRGGKEAGISALLISSRFFQLLPRVYGLAALPATAIFSVYGLSNPAYRVTLPCVVQIAYIRQKNLFSLCPSCNKGNARSAKFCNECGTRLGD